MKKLLYKITRFTVALTLAVSCEKESNLDPEGQWTLSNPALIEDNLDSTIILDETTPNDNLTLSWEEATSSAGFAVSYEVFIDGVNTEFTTPVIARESSNSGELNSISINYRDLDEALSFLEIKAGEIAEVQWAVRATSLTRTSMATGKLKLQRFASESLPSRLFLSGTATENDNNIENAIPMRRLRDVTGRLTNQYEVYTSLKNGGTFKFYSQPSSRSLNFGFDSENNIEIFGNEIEANEDGVYRISVDLENKTLQLLKIDFWSVVGAPIENAWNGDEPLEYQGNGVFSRVINFINTGNYLFRANKDWALVLKNIVGTTNTVAFEADAKSQGVEVEDLSASESGLFLVTLDLSGDNYTVTLEKTTVAPPQIEIPQQLFLLENGTAIAELVNSNNIFSNSDFIPLQANNSYRLNSLADGSGINYSLLTALGNSTNPGGDKVSESENIVQSDDAITIVEDRAFQISVDFNSQKLNWTYYNFKLFHWVDWPNRSEIPMMYVHPNIYTITAPLTTGYNSKFISPWDFDLGASNPSSLAGDAAVGGADINNIDSDGTYTVTITLNSDYQSGNYEFKKQ